MVKIYKTKEEANMEARRLNIKEKTHNDKIGWEYFGKEINPDIILGNWKGKAYVMGYRKKP